MYSIFAKLYLSFLKISMCVKRIKVECLAVDSDELTNECKGFLYLKRIKVKLIPVKEPLEYFRLLARAQPIVRAVDNFALILQMGTNFVLGFGIV